METMRYKLLTCEVFARQAYYLAAFAQDIIDIELVDKGLHEEPDKLRARLQERLNDLPAERYDAVLLGYGLCSNSTAGLVCPHAPMVIPRAHDCITVFLGSRERYSSEFRDHPGTFWYAPDYIERGGGSAGSLSLGVSDDEKSMAKVYQEYVAKYGQDNADYLMEVMGAWREHYERAAYVAPQEMEMPDYRPGVREQAERRNWAFVELAGSLVILRDLISGHWDDNDFLVIAPGDTLTPSNDASIVACCAVCAAS
jgi:hypothetical protein